MLILDVIIEYTASSLNRPFSYIYNGSEKVAKGLRVIVPFANKKIVGYVVSFHEESRTKEQYENDTGFELKEVDSLLDHTPILNDELVALADEISNYYFAPLISVYQAMLPPSLKPKLSSLSKPKISFDAYLKVIDENEESLTPKQIEILRLLKNNGLVLKKDIKSTAVKSLIEKKRVEIVYKEKIRLVQEQIAKEEKKTLNDDQRNAVEQIVNSEDKVFLLEGVTGSGKTEVYLQASEQILAKNKSVLILVPEISLTVAMVNHFKARFDNIAILHSALTPAEKYDEYRRIAKRQVHIVVGARSAIFAPLENLGLIVIDEEQSETYKQENLPYYNAITVALMRKVQTHCRVVLGSATPSLESRIRAMRNNYIHLKLPHRINEMMLPKTQIIDMLDIKNIDKESIMISKALREAIEDRLSKKEQVILLLNRRGYSTFVSCRKCGHILKCPTCNIPLTYHYEDGLLKCHHCGHVELMPNSCPHCHSTYLSRTGFGSEKVEKEIEKLFPKAKVLRLDSDVSRIKDNVPKIINSFANHEADILIGTQIVAKGHDFKDVTLVGVILADIGLAIPSFRASERTFSLLTQVIGRAGRDKKVGEAIIQTYSPKNYVIYDASIQNYDRFFNEEMVNRKLNQYPPYTFCLILTISAKLDSEAEEIADKYKNYLETAFANKNVDVIGPSVPFILKQNDRFRRKILLKYKRYDDIHDVIVELQHITDANSKIKMQVNVDPYEDY